MSIVHHLLQVSDALDLELASALAELVPVIGWEPQSSMLPGRVLIGQECERAWPEQPSLRLRRLPLLRGYARPPISWFANTSQTTITRLLVQTPEPLHSPLICTTPYFAGVAELWPGPVVYWLTDLIAEYASANRKLVYRLDRRMCKAATVVCPNSRRLAEYLIGVAGCEPEKIQILPNATRAANILPNAPGPMADAVPDGPMVRPVAGIIGNLAGNMDWVLLERLIALCPQFSWIFVGPTQMKISDRKARRARNAVMDYAQTRFVGRKPYGELASYARAFDVAVLPYLRCEPTYSGSSTRFYEHLAACRPMVATPGLEELRQKVPLLKLVESAEEAAEALEALRSKSFDDQLSEDRWRASLQGTWQVRAATMLDALNARVGIT